MPKLPKICFLPLLLSCSLSSAITLGRVVVADPLVGSRSIIYEQINGFAVVEGDILVAKITDLRRFRAVIRHKIGGSRWPDGIIPYEIAEDLPFKNKLAVLQAIAHWQEKTNIKLVELTSKNRHIYRDYVVFVPAEGTTCSSYVGKQGGRQEINLSTRCTAMNTVHEIGHALGLWHEQSRADRAEFIRILWENIEEDHKFNFDQHLTDGEDFGSYDYQSIMHYGAYAFAKNGKRTIEPLMDGIEIGQRNYLSDKDIAAINAMYPNDY